MRATILCLLLSVVAISADLQSDFADIYNHLPKEQIKSIGQKYAASNEGFRNRLLQVQSLDADKFVNIKEVADLIKYLTRRGLNGERLVRGAIAFTKHVYGKFLEPEQSNSGETVITGDYNNDLQKVIHSSGIVNVIRQKYVTSPDFANFVAAIRDPEFKNLMYRIVYSKDLTWGCTDCKAVERRGASASLQDVVAGLAVLSQ